MEIAVTILICFILLGLIFRFAYTNYEKLESPIILVLSYLCFAIAIVFIIILGEAYRFYIGKGILDMESTGQVGDFVGGVIGTLVTGISVVLLYKTLQEQKTDSKNQAKQFINSQIENRFFELLKFHRDNVNEIEFTYFEHCNKTNCAKGRHFFVTANKQLEYAFEEFEGFVKYYNYTLEDLYEEVYLTKLKSNQTIINRGIEKMYLLAKIDICYLVIFFGVSKNRTDELVSLTKDKYKPLFMNQIISYFRMKPSKSSRYYVHWKKLIDDNNLTNNLEFIYQERENRKKQIQGLKDLIGETNENIYYPDNYVKYYGGHQFRLGHYFRHLYQIVNFIHKNKTLEPEDKANYTRILRGQLSDYEQVLFFYNSLSQLGRVWELADSRDNVIPPEDHLITNYSLLKSISKTILTDQLKSEDIYPIRHK